MLRTSSGVYSRTRKPLRCWCSTRPRLQKQSKAFADRAAARAVLAFEFLLPQHLSGSKISVMIRQRILLKMKYDRVCGRVRLRSSRFDRRKHLMSDKDRAEGARAASVDAVGRVQYKKAEGAR